MIVSIVNLKIRKTTKIESQTIKINWVFIVELF